MNEIPSSVTDKIQKLLRFATSDNQHEAELALAAAKRLAVMNEIDLLSINAWSAKEEYEQTSIDSGKRVSVCGHYVSWIIQRHFNTKIIWSGGRDSGRKIIFVGKKSDIEVANYVYAYLTKTMMELWRGYQKSHNADTKSRASWLRGCYNGLNAKLEEAKIAAEKESFNSLAPEAVAEVRNRYAVACVSKKAELESAVSKFFPPASQR